jgi:hypothetical protein
MSIDADQSDDSLTESDIDLELDTNLSDLNIDSIFESDVTDFQSDIAVIERPKITPKKFLSSRITQKKTSSAPIDIPLSRSLPNTFNPLISSYSFNSTRSSPNDYNCTICDKQNCKSSYHYDVTRYCKTCGVFIGTTYSLYCLKCEPNY